MSKHNNRRKKRFIKERNEYGNIIKDSDNYIKFNFKYFTSGDGYGQSFEEWQKDEILADLNEKLTEVSGKTKVELMQDGTLEIFTNGYPPDSFFERPRALKPLNLRWSRIRLTGRRRLIGFFLPDNSNYETDDKQEKTADSNAEQIIDDIVYEGRILSDIIGKTASVVSMHRPSKEILDADLGSPGFVNSYGYEFFHVFKYVSDSRRRWREPIEDDIEKESFVCLARY